MNDFDTLTNHFRSVNNTEAWNDALKAAYMESVSSFFGSMPEKKGYGWAEALAGLVVCVIIFAFGFFVGMKI